MVPRPRPLAAEGHVDVSPRGHDGLSVLGPYRVARVDVTGSGVETAAHRRAARAGRAYRAEHPPSTAGLPGLPVSS